MCVYEDSLLSRSFFVVPNLQCIGGDDAQIYVPVVQSTVSNIYTHVSLLLCEPARAEMKRKRGCNLEEIRSMYARGCMKWDVMIADGTVEHPVWVDSIPVPGEPSRQYEATLDFPLEFRVDTGVPGDTRGGSVLLCWPWLRVLNRSSFLCRILDTAATMMKEQENMLSSVTEDHPYPVVTLRGVCMNHPEDLLCMLGLIRAINTRDEAVPSEIGRMDTTTLTRMALLGDEMGL